MRGEQVCIGDMKVGWDWEVESHWSSYFHFHCNNSPLQFPPCFSTIRFQRAQIEMGSTQIAKSYWVAVTSAKIRPFWS